MTKKMLAVALMLSSVAVLAGCTETPTEPETLVTTGDEMVVEPAVEEISMDEVVTGDEEIMTGATEDDTAVAVEPEVEIVAAE